MRLPLTDLLERALPSAVAHFLGGHPVDSARLGEWAGHYTLLRALRTRSLVWRRLTTIELDALPRNARWGTDAPIPSVLLRQLYAACQLRAPGGLGCGECGGSGLYRGLLVVEPCRACRG